ncbi:magnesium transporter CorA family protein [Candidatus Woesearchaeota archaeon]|nr:magnesium transporter CorA family protein [Candidatus Woesearchaeota archaeon]
MDEKMIRYIHILNGQIKKGSGAGYQKPKKNELLWIFLLEPSSEELNKAIRDFSLEKRPFERFTKENHSMRYSMDPFEFVIIDYFLENGKIGYAYLLFIIRENLLIVTSNKNNRFYEELFENITEHIEKNRIPPRNIGRILHAFLQEDIEENYDVLDKMAEAISGVEERAANFQGAQAVDVQEIIRLKRKLFVMGRRFWASTKIIFLLKAGFTNVKLDEETSKLLVDVHDTFLHQMDIVAGQKEMLTDVMNVYATSISNKLALTSNELNQTMKKMSAFALILLIPTLISSIYGMNFQNIPLTQSKYGLHIVIAAMGLIIIFLLYAFRKKAWI